MNSARYPFTYQSIVYSKKPEGVPNEYYITGTINYIKKLVEDLSSYHNLKGRIYTSFEVADWLLERGITTVGTMQKNRFGIPPDVKGVKSKELLSYELYWRSDGKCNLSSYEVKTSNGKRNPLMLSTFEPLLGITKNDKKKPAIMKL